LLKLPVGVLVLLLLTLLLLLLLLLQLLLLFLGVPRMLCFATVRCLDKEPGIVFPGSLSILSHV